MKHNKGGGGRQDYFINLCHKKVFFLFFSLSIAIAQLFVSVCVADDAHSLACYVKVNLIRASLLNNSNLVTLMGKE